MDHEPTIEDIAKRAKVSMATVSRVLNSKRQEKWASKKLQAEHIRKIAREIGYRPNAAARAMKSGSPTQISIIVNQLSPTAWEYELIEGVMDELYRSGTLFAITVDARSFEAKGLPKELESNAFAGLIAINPDEFVRKALDKTPHVWMDSNGFASKGFVNRDERGAGALCLEQIAKLGFKKAFFLGLDRWEGCHHCVIDRESGAEEAARRLGVEFKAIRTQLFKSSMSRYEAALLDSVEEGCAVIAWNYALADWCSHKTALHGLAPGLDYSLVCCEETHETPVIWPELSRVSYDRLQMGAIAARGVLDIIDGKIEFLPSALCKGDWIEGATCVKAKDEELAL